MRIHADTDPKNHCFGAGVGAGRAEIIWDMEPEPEPELHFK